MSELWDNPLIPIEERLQIADGAVKFRDGVIENLRAQLADARAALSTEAQGEPVMYVRVDALARLKKFGKLNMVGYNHPNHSPLPVVALYTKATANTVALQITAETDDPPADGGAAWAENVKAHVANLKADTVTLGREEYEAVLSAGEAIIARWDSPLWKDLPHTAEYIDDLREDIDAASTGKDE